MYQGKIIEFIDQGRFICAICLQDKGSKLHLLTRSNRELNISPKRAIFISDVTMNIDAARVELLENLKRREEYCNRLKERIDVQELWSLIKDESDVYNHRYLAQLCFGESVGDEHVSAIVRALFEDRLYFRLKDGCYYPNSEKRIDQITKQREEEARRNKLIERGGTWLRQALQGNRREDPPYDQYTVGLLKQIALSGKEAPDFKYTAALLEKAGIRDYRKARHLLIELGVWEKDENLDILRFQIDTEFKEEQISESARLARRNASENGRHDLRHLPAVTIDGPETKDFDDAISFEKKGDIFFLGIHISDVASVISQESLLDKASLERASSLYLPRHHIPMIPPDLSQGTLSLKKQLDRNAISLLTQFNLDGELLDFQFVPSIIQVKHNLAYDRVNNELGNDGLYREMYQLSRKLHNKRIRHGALNLSIPELEIDFNPPKTFSIRQVPQDTPSRLIVAEFMILYNWLAAKFCMENRIPVLYRSQAQPSEIVTEDERGYLYYVFTQRRKLHPLTIDTAPKPHSGLGLDVYTHTTSPIRRYLDLVMQRQMGNFLLGKPGVYNEKQLDEIRIYVETIIRNLGRIRRNRIRYWILKYLNQHKEQCYPALVLYEMKNKTRVLVTDFLLLSEIKRESTRTLKPGEKIIVRVRKADPWADTLELILSVDS